MIDPSRQEWLRRMNEERQSKADILYLQVTVVVLIFICGAMLSAPVIVRELISAFNKLFGGSNA